MVFSVKTKIVIKGDRNVGKSCLFNLEGRKFTETYIQTEEIQVASKRWIYKSTDDIVVVEVWDVDKENNEVMLDSSITKEVGSLEVSDVPALDSEFFNSYEGISGVVLVMDVTKSWTFEYVQREINKVPSSIPVLVLGNHYDASDHRSVTADRVIRHLKTLRRSAPARYAESSISDGFGLEVIRKWFNIPFFEIQRETLLAHLDANQIEIEIIDYSNHEIEQKLSEASLAGNENERTLEIGKPSRVLVTFIKNKKEFFVAFEDSIHELATMLGSEDIYALAPVLEIEEGTLGLAPFDDELCRIEVYKTDPFGVGGCDTVLVSFIDYGNESIVKVDELKVLPERYNNIPPMAFQMKLHSGKVLSDDLAENQVITLTPLEKVDKSWLTLIEDEWTDEVEEIDVLITKEIYDACQYVKTIEDVFGFDDHEDCYEDYANEPSNEIDPFNVKLKLDLPMEQPHPTPNHNVMKTIIQLTNYPVLATGNERTFGPPLHWEKPMPDVDCTVVCDLIPDNIMEDELILLFGRVGVIYSLRLPMNSSSERNLGHCFVKFSTKEEADKVIKQNDFKLDGKTLKLYKETEWKKIPSRVEEEHICTHSNDVNLCSCISEMIDTIKMMMVGIEERKRNLDSETISKAEKANLIRYVFHSLRMEAVSTSDNISNTIEVSQYACNIEDKFTKLHVRKIFELLKVGEENCFRDPNTEEVFVIGVYEEMNSLPPASEIHSSLEKILDRLDEEFADVVIKASFISAKYVLLHPHPDGNGRMSRIIFNMILRKAGFPFITFPLGEKIKYFEAINLITNRDDFTLYHRFVCQCIIQSLQCFHDSL